MADNTNRKQPRPHRYAGLRPNERKAARRDALLDAGLELFGTVGLAGTKVLDVCVQADLTMRYFYENFSSFDEFASAVVQKVAVDLATKAIAASLQQKADRDGAHAVLAEVVRIFDEDPRICRIILVETAQAGGALAALRRRMLMGVATALQQMRDPKSEVTVAELVMPMALAVTSGDVSTKGPVGNWAPGAFAVAGAVAELLVARVDGEIDMTREELTSYLDRLLDFTIEWPGIDGGGGATGNH